MPAPKRRARPKKQAQPADDVPPKRGRGRPKGSKNLFTLEREKIQRALNKEKLGPKKFKGPQVEPREILLHAANFWHQRAMFLSDHARKLADEEADAHQIDAAMAECDKYLTMACKAAEQVSPYCHARVSGGLGDGDVVTYVARLPTPAANSEEWAKESTSQASGWKRPQ
ncbi:MAG: hypothetical protein J2P54_15815 [Bradyrhizobiaceae bacterium]|nr:hypothetical protein [Bradyrhizobiaceae bacterium]